MRVILGKRLIKWKIIKLIQCEPNDLYNFYFVIGCFHSDQSFMVTTFVSYYKKVVFRPSYQGWQEVYTRKLKVTYVDE